MMSFVFYTDVTFHLLSTTNEYSRYQRNCIAMPDLGFIVGAGQTQSTNFSTILIYFCAINIGSFDSDGRAIHSEEINFT